VIVHDPVTPPIVRVMLVLVAYEADEESRRMIVSQACATPLRAVNGAPLILYSPPSIDSAVCPLMPDTVTVFEAY